VNDYVDDGVGRAASLGLVAVHVIVHPIDSPLFSSDDSIT